MNSFRIGIQDMSFNGENSNIAQTRENAFVLYRDPKRFESVPDFEKSEIHKEQTKEQREKNSTNIIQKQESCSDKFNEFVQTISLLHQVITKKNKNSINVENTEKQIKSDSQKINQDTKTQNISNKLKKVLRDVLSLEPKEQIFIIKEIYQKDITKQVLPSAIRETLSYEEINEINEENKIKKSLEKLNNMPKSIKIEGSQLPEKTIEAIINLVSSKTNSENMSCLYKRDFYFHVRLKIKKSGIYLEDIITSNKLEKPVYLPTNFSIDHCL